MSGADLLGDQAPAPKRKGRPPGAVAKATKDWRAYIESVHAGLSPGRALAAIALPTEKELRAAKGDIVKAVAAKAATLADLLAITKEEAWDRCVAALRDLMPYMHQRLTSIELTPGDGGALLPLIMMPPRAPPPAEAVQGKFSIIQPHSQPAASEVAPSKSHGDQQTLIE